MSSINAKQYWLLKDGSVVRVRQKWEESSWLVHKVYIHPHYGGFAPGVKIKDEDFERELDPDEAKQLAMELLEKHLHTFFERCCC